MELYAYANQLAAERSAPTPSDDIISVLLQAEVDGERLTELEFDLFFLLLAVAGNETTRNLISHGHARAHASTPTSERRLLDDPSLMPGAVEEMLRWAHAGDALPPHRDQRTPRSAARRSPRATRS